MTQETAVKIEQHDMTVGIFHTHAQAEQAVRKLLDAGLPAQQLSIVTQGLEVREEVQGYVTTGQVALTGAETGGWVGGFVGLFTGAAFLWVPVIGPLIVLGALASTVLGVLEGGAAGGIFGAIWGHYIERDHVLKYQQALQGGKLLVTVHGTTEDLAVAQRVLGEAGGQELQTYHIA